MTPRSNSFLAATSLLSVLSGTAILNLASPANALTLVQTQDYTSSLPGNGNIFQQFDSALGTLKSVYLALGGTATTEFGCSSSPNPDGFCAVLSVLGGASSFGPIYTIDRPGFTGANRTSFISVSTGTSRFFTEVSPFIGTGRIGSYGFYSRTDGIYGEGLNFPFISAPTYSVKASLTYEYEVPDPIPPSTPVPTPALLPGLIGMGAAALRKRKQEVEGKANPILLSDSL